MDKKPILAMLLIIVLLGMLGSTSRVRVVADITRSAGVSIGDWWRYDINFTWLTAPYPNSVCDLMNNTDWLKCTVLDVSGTNVTFQQLCHLKNGTETGVIGWIDVSTGHSNASSSFMICPYIVVPANLEPGDPIYTEAYPYNQWKINATMSRTYVGALIEANFLNASVVIAYYAKDSGILCELQIMYSDYTIHGVVIESPAIPKKVTVSVLIAYDIENMAWYNVTLSGRSSVFNATLTVATVNYTSHGELGIIVDAINDVWNDLPYAWVWWHWNFDEATWVQGLVACDQYVLGSTNLIAWYYENTESSPLPPPPWPETPPPVPVPVPCWVRVGTYAEYLLTDLKDANETAVWKWEVVSVTGQIEVLHTFEGLGIPDYPSVFKSIIDPATRGIIDVIPIDKELPDDSSPPLFTSFTLWAPVDTEINDTALVIGPYGPSYPPAPVLRFENISSPLETEECVTFGFEIEEGYLETDLWYYNIYTNVLVKFYMNWPTYDAEGVVMLKQWVPIQEFNFTYGEETYDIVASSNSTITEFFFDPEEGAFIALNITGPEGTHGFCNITIPDDLLWGEFSVYMDGSLLTRDEDYTQTYNGTHYIFFINYTHSTHVIEIRGSEAIPEFPSFLIPTLFIIVTLLAVIIRKRRCQETHSSDLKP